MKAVEKLQVQQVMISTPDGLMPAVFFTYSDESRQPAILLLMEAFGLTSHIQDVAARLAQEGYAVLVPDFYYRELPNNTFGYDEVEKARAMMFRLDFGAPIQQDLYAALTYLKSRPEVSSEAVGVTGFCLGGGLAFLIACTMSDQIAAAAPFYGVVLDEWIDAIPNIAVPLCLFFGGADPFISSDRIHQIETQLNAHHKDYTLQVYPEADHGFFCHERSSYNPVAANAAWQELMQFFKRHL